MPRRESTKEGKGGMGLCPARVHWLRNLQVAPDPTIALLRIAFLSSHDRSMESWPNSLEKPIKSFYQESPLPTKLRKPWTSTEQKKH